MCAYFMPGMNKKQIKTIVLICSAYFILHILLNFYILFKRTNYHFTENVVAQIIFAFLGAFAVERVMEFVLFKKVVWGETCISGWLAISQTILSSLIAIFLLFASVFGFF